jgi:ABC-type bacteriocin/lantibiotic exporter with double-glycine peptidase domain
VKWQAYHTHQDGETDCGPACVRSVLRRHGKLVDTVILRESVGLGEGGASLLRLKQVLESYEVSTQLFQLTVSQLHQAVTHAGPTIVLFKEDGFAHFVVVHEALPGGGFTVSDPLFYRPVTMSSQELDAAFSGESLVTDTPPVGLTRRSRWSHAWATSMFAHELRTNRRTISVIIMATLLVAALSISSSIYLQIAVDASLVSTTMGALTLTSLMFLAMIVGAGTLQYVRGRIIVWFGQHMQRKLSEQYVGKLMRLPPQFFGSRRTGDLAGRLDDVQGIQGLLTSTTIGVSVDIAIVLIVGGYLAWESLPLFGVLLCSSLVAAVTSWILYRGIREAAEEALQRDASLKSELINVLNHHEVVFSHGKREFAARRISRTLSRRITSQAKLGRLDNVSSVVEVLNRGLFTILVAWIGLLRVRQGQMTLGQLFSFISLSGYFLTSLQNISTLQTTLQRTSAAMGRYRDIMLQREVPRAAPAETRQGEQPGSVLVRDLSFSYPGTARRVIDGFSLSVPAGRTVHLQGGNASGKSTLLKLMAGLYTSEEGHVSLGGHPLGLASEDTSPKVLYLPETPMIINATVWDNLTFGDRHSRTEVDRACALACAESVVASFPDGYDEVIREDRVRLSRGQLQRLGLARALLVNPEVYLFDESFSGIDSKTFARIWESLAELPATKILVAHREVAGMRFDLSVELENAASDESLVKEPA